MKSTYTILCLLLSIVISNNCIGQWQQTNCPLDDYVNSITPNGTDIFAGTEGGGIYLSHDNGDNWLPINNGLTNSGMHVHAIAVKGADIFAGTSGGIFISSDSGNNWTAINNGLTDTSINALIVIGSNIIAGSFYNGDIYLSQDNGQNWSLVFSDAHLEINDFSTDGTNIYAARGNGVFVSNNSGLNWTEVNNSGLLETYVASIATDGSNIFAGTGLLGSVYLSINDGNSWSQKHNGLPSFPGALYNSLAIVGSNVFVSTSHSGVYLTTNYGENWTNISQGILGVVIQTMAVSQAYVYIGTQTSGVWKRSLSEFVGIEDINTTLNISLAPNPAIDQVFIKSIDKINSITIYDIVGRRIENTKWDKENSIIDISRLEKGIYIFVINDCLSHKVFIE